MKVVPRKYIADLELQLFQYTAIDEFTCLRFLAAYPEQSTYSSADFLKKLVNWTSSINLSALTHLDTTEKWNVTARQFYMQYKTSSVGIAECGHK